MLMFLIFFKHLFCKGEDCLSSSHQVLWRNRSLRHSVSSVCTSLFSK